MASIPLPALDIKPPQPQQNPMEQMGNLIRLRTMMQMAPLQQQAMQQQVQSGQLDVQQKQMALDSSRALMGAFSGLDPNDPQYFDKGIKNALQSHQVLPQQLQGVMNARQTYMKNALEMTGDQLKNNQAVADSLYSIGSQYLKGSDGDMLRAWPQVRQRIMSVEGLNPQMAEQQIPMQFPGRDWVQAHTIMAGTSAAMARAAAAQQQANTSTATFNAEHGPLSDPQIQQLNQAFAARYQTLNPGKQPPAGFQLGPNATQDDFKRLDTELSGQEKAQGTAASIALRSQMMGLSAQFRAQQLQNSQNQQLYQAFNYANSAITKDMQPLKAMAQRIGRLQDTISEANPQADPLIAPELLSVMAGGPGSGLRMNEAEIARAVGGQTAWTKLKYDLNYWSANPNKARIPPEQRAQISKLAQYVEEKANEQLNIGMNAQQDLVGATDVNQVHQILGKYSRDYTQSVTQSAPQNSQSANQAHGGAAPEGTRIKVGDKYMVKRSGKWVDE